jgi:hypothetical protein
MGASGLVGEFAQAARLNSGLAIGNPCQDLLEGGASEGPLERAGDSGVPGLKASSRSESSSPGSRSRWG